VDALVRQSYEVLWNTWDDDAVDRILAEDFVFRGSLGHETTGGDGWRRYRDLVRAGSHDFRNEVLMLVVDTAGTSAAARLRYTGTHSGALLGARRSPGCRAPRSSGCWAL